MIPFVDPTALPSVTEIKLQCRCGLVRVRVEVGGRAYYSGRASFSVEAGDPLGGGFLLR